MLLADDDQFIRQVLEKQVGSFGDNVHTANNGVDALECFIGKTAPKIAILDWMMPGLSGINLCKKIRNDKDYWQNIEDYLCEHADVKFSHSLYRDCMYKESPEFIDRVNEHK